MSSRSKLAISAGSMFETVAATYLAIYWLVRRASHPFWAERELRTGMADMGAVGGRAIALLDAAVHRPCFAQAADSRW
jgi:hypothetical protein